MKKIILIGVCHTVATLDETMEYLKGLPFGQDSIVFVEPKRSILDGTLRCENPAIMGFFRKVLEFLFSRNAEVVPLNPEFTPSHHATMLYRKIAQQLAEEEYMVDVIASYETAKQKYVIIGDIHAPRIRKLLTARGIPVQYKSLSIKTPSDEVVESWRSALTGKARNFIGLEWLSKFRSDLRKRMGVDSSTEVPTVFYGNRALYQRYLAEAHEMEVRGEEDRTAFMHNVTESMVKDAGQIKTDTLRHLKKNKRTTDHEPVKDCRIRIFLL